MKKIDYARLSSDLKAQAESCKQAKLAYKEAQRALDRAPKNQSYQDYLKLSCAIGSARNVSMTESDEMTKLCVFRAHLRGRTHLTPNSAFNDYVEGWIESLTERYTIEVLDEDQRAAG